MRITLSRIIALLVAGGMAAISIVQDGKSFLHAAGAVPVLLIPLALIWFPEEVGEFTGYVGRGGNIDAPSPAFLVAGFGWFFLVGLPVLLYILRP